MRNLVVPTRKTYQLIYAMLFSFLAAWSIQNVYAVSSWKDLILFGIIISGILMTLYFARLAYDIKLPIPILIIYLLIGSFFIGSGIISIDVGPIGVFPYRVFLGVMTLWLVIELFQRKYILQAKFVRVKPTVYFFLFWVGYGLLSLVWVRSVTLGIKDFLFLVSGVLTILFVILFLYKQRDYLVFFYLWLAADLLFILLGFWNHITHNHLPISRLATAPAYIQGRPSAVFTNENDYASFMAIGIFFGFSLFNHSKNIMYKILGLFVLLSGLYLILVSTSRASVIAVLLGFLVWYLLLASKKEKIRIFWIGVILSLLSGILFFERVKALVSNVINELASVLGNPEVEEGSVDIRKNLLRNGIEFVQDTFGFGIGAGNAEYYIKNLSIYPTYGQTNLHNWWAEIMVNYGLLIFTGYVLIYFGIIFKLYKAFKNSVSSQTKMISEALFIGFIVFSISSISPSSVMTLSYTWLLFAFGLGYLNYLYLNKTNARDYQYEQHSTTYKN
ncbi:O-antigen ligase family protein [Pseudalkalibacillus decolorationis]|uniref:O-antigen ligase family protein n=1 Tax=Pseudalkalibacillus decolorationis TaxID=163879 RepID=UPI002148DF84|nr:O-antigen ligase family protein [Pseudalkalibacillus decolorationis]